MWTRRVSLQRGGPLSFSFLCGRRSSEGSRHRVPTAALEVEPHLNEPHLDCPPTGLPHEAPSWLELLPPQPTTTLPCQTCKPPEPTPPPPLSKALLPSR